MSEYRAKVYKVKIYTDDPDVNDWEDLTPDKFNNIDFKGKHFKEIKYGHNLNFDTSSLFECSICHWSCWDTLCGDTTTYNYCPNCGARMIEK